MTETTIMQITCPVSLCENRVKASTSKFEIVLMNAVDDSLSSFGESFKQVVYFQLEQKFQIHRWEIPKKIDEFAEAIEGMFGIGAALIETKILKSLHKQVPSFVHFPSGDTLVFTDYVKNLCHHA
jgi:hypothetical protein